MLRYTTDRARPGLVALYNIQPGYGVGQFLQLQSPQDRTQPEHSQDMEWVNSYNSRARKGLLLLKIYLKLPVM